MAEERPIKGRGTQLNRTSRFQPLRILTDFEELPVDEEFAEVERPRTEYLIDPARTIIATNDSPDVGFDASVNPYRGCEHGCIYCYARPTHEYLDMSAGLDFETKILVKMEAAALLRKELSARSWRPRVLGFSGVTDPYQPVERRLKLTRGCLEVLAEFRNPVAMITKNHLITRDIDLLAELARHDAVGVHISITTLDADLTRVMEPRTSVPKQRLAAIRELSAAGVPVGVLVAPVIPGLTDHEMPAIVAAAVEAGATGAGFVTLRLPFVLKDLFSDWLGQHFPDRKEKVLNRIRSLRGGKLNDSEFGSRMRGDGIFADQMKAMFKMSCQRAGLSGERKALSAEAFRRPGDGQMGLW